MRVRGVGRGEVDLVAGLYSLLLDHHRDVPGFAAGVGSEDRVRDHLGAALADPDAELLVAEDGGQLQGFVLVRVLRRPPLFRETERGEVEALFVRDDARRSGLGRALAEAGLSWLTARGLARAALQVAVPNEAGRAFWRALGFEPAMDVLERRL